MPQLQNNSQNIQSSSPNQLQGNLSNFSDILGGLLNLAGQGTQMAGKAGKVFLEEQPLAKLVNLIQLSGTALGGLSNVPSQQNLMKSLEGTQTAQQNPNFNPYQEGVKKALKESGYNHASEALQQGVPPEHIVQQSGIQPIAGAMNNDISQILANPDVGQGKINNSQKQDIQPNISFGGQPQQSNNFIEQNPLSNFFAKLGITPTPSNQLLLSQVALNKQKLAGQQPLQQSDYQQAALDVQKQIQQAIQVPPTQAEKLSNQAAIYGHQVTAINDLAQKNLDDISKANEELKTLSEYRSWVSKGFGSIPKAVKEKMNQINLLHIKQIELSNSLNSISANPPGIGEKNKFQEGQTYRDKNGNTAVYRNGKFE